MEDCDVRGQRIYIQKINKIKKIAERTVTKRKSEQYL